ncbi:MAG: DUF2478 domain-containing protein [Burkholderiaceae bacterium]
MQADDDQTLRLPVAAIHNDGDGDVDGRLARFAHEQRAQGRRVLGLLMSTRDLDAGCRASMWLTDIDTGDEYLVSQPLGRDSRGCAADPQGFALASGVLRDALTQSPDLVICNRFGTLEAENGGFVSELLALMAEGIPVLTVVSTRHLEAWRRFAGEAPLLPNEPAAWARWLATVQGTGGG